MAKIVARNVRISLGGRDLSTRSNSTTLRLTAETPEVTAFTDSIKCRIADSVKDVELTVDGFQDVAASQVDELYNSMLGASGIVGQYPEGYGASKVGKEFVGILSNYEMRYPLAEAAAFSTTFSGTGNLYYTRSLGYTTMSSAGTSPLSSVDYGASPSDSMYGFVRLYTLTGTTPEFSASIQNSPDDSTWTTALVITDKASMAGIGVSSASWSAITGASRYRRASIQLAGTSPCATFMVSAS